MHRYFTLLVAVALVASASGLPVATPDRAALEALYAATGGATWLRRDGWLGPSSPCTWYGVECDEHAHVASLRLESNNLVGVVSPDLANIAALVNLSLANNALSGALSTLPPALRTLNVASNSLTALPHALPATLVRAVVSTNRLGSGDIKTLASLPVLALLAARSNAFTAFPYFFASSALQVLDVSDNPITASLEDVAASLVATRLRVLNIGDTHIGGTLAGATALWPPTLTTLLAAGSALEGTLDAAQNLRALTRLDLSRTRINGSLPESALAMPPQLVELRLETTRMRAPLHARMSTLVTSAHVVTSSSLLPAYVSVDYWHATLLAGGMFVCPALAGASGDGDKFTLVLDPAYHGYTLCVCGPGYVGSMALDGGCEKCPRGALCSGGSVVSALEGHYVELNGSVVACAPGFPACQGLDAPCALGYEGWRCEQCGDGYARWGRQCVECISPALPAFAYVGTLLKIALSAALISAANAPLLRVIATYVQFSALLGALASAWHNDALRALLLFEDSSNVAPHFFECLGLGFAARQLTAALTPLLAVLTTAVIIAISERARRFRRLAPTSRAQQLGSLYLAFCITSIASAARLWSVVRCVTTDAGERVESWQAQACGDAGVTAPSLLAAVFYSIIVPLLVLLVLLRRRNAATHYHQLSGAAKAAAARGPETAAAPLPSAFVGAAWRPKIGGWELVVLVRTLALVLAIAVMPRDGAAQPLTIVGILFFSATLTAYVRPHLRNSTNVAETASLFALALAHVAAVVALAEPALALQLSWGVFALNICIVSMFAAVFLGEARLQYLRSRPTRSVGPESRASG